MNQNKGSGDRAFRRRFPRAFFFSERTFPSGFSGSDPNFRLTETTGSDMISPELNTLS